MRQKFSIFRNEDGSVLVITLLTLVALTLIGIAAITTSTIEIQIAANDKFYKTAFHNADSGVFAVPKVISVAMDENITPGDISGAEKRYGAFTYFDPGTSDDGSSGRTFYRELVGLDDHDISFDIGFVLNNNAVNVDVRRDRAENLVGGGVEFLSGYEGVGVGSSGGVAVFFELDSSGSAPRNTLSNIGAFYRNVIGTAGGM